MSLQYEILRAIRSDEDFNSKEERRIIKAYKGASEESKAVMDDIFISLCGYSLKTLIGGE